MPMPMPEHDEDHDAFIERCMGDENMQEFEDEGQRQAVCEAQWNKEEESKAMKYPHIASAVFNHPWAILPETLQTITSILRFRMEGGTLTKEEIQARLGAAQDRPATVRGGSIAVLPLIGVLAQRMNMMIQVSGGTSTEIFGRAFRQMVADPTVKAVVLDIHSPGGETFGIDELTTEIFQARKAKPIIAVANSLAASGAYWIGTAASELWAAPGALVGSVGVYAEHMDLSKAAEMAGMKMTFISAGEFKVEGNEFEPLSDAGRAHIQGIVDDIYGQFVKAVARNRGVTEAAVRNGFGKGRLVTARQAMAMGMIDGIGTLDQVLRRLGGSHMAEAATMAADGRERHRLRMAMIGKK